MEETFLNYYSIDFIGTLDLTLHRGLFNTDNPVSSFFLPRHHHTLPRYSKFLPCGWSYSMLSHSVNPVIIRVQLGRCRFIDFIGCIIFRFPSYSVSVIWSSALVRISPRSHVAARKWAGRSPTHSPSRA